ncbi:hypothetical protein BDC45DRAFT_536663 [Circinella umbellata]|nr:hypothetical protein BDC45DRAFT_536647 [Circinella umbellata]KAI7853192.1 hypothetical protein BDC45DRAFT_536663 [Circinella umbellata]
MSIIAWNGMMFDFLSQDVFFFIIIVVTYLSRTKCTIKGQLLGKYIFKSTASGTCPTRYTSERCKEHFKCKILCLTIMIHIPKAYDGTTRLGEAEADKNLVISSCITFAFSSIVFCLDGSTIYCRTPK